MSAVVCALKMTIKREANPASAVIPYVKTRRLPLKVNWRGRNPSLACRAPSRGKSAKEVLAAMIKMSVVLPNRIYHITPPPHTARPSCEMTVSVQENCAPTWMLRKVIPRNMTARMELIQMRVMPAFRLCGSLKAVIPFEMASTPVSAVQPLEKARRMRKRLNPLVASIMAGLTPVTSGRPPVR